MDLLKGPQTIKKQLVNFKLTLFPDVWDTIAEVK